VPEASVLRIRPGSRVETPLCRLAHRLAVTSGWRRYGLAFLLGVCATATLFHPQGWSATRPITASPTGAARLVARGARSRDRTGSLDAKTRKPVPIVIA
jgi:hypothetical protein